MLWTGTNSTNWQPFDFMYLATVDSLRFDSGANVNGGYVEFDDVVVTEDTGIRPGELLQDGDMEASGTGYWTNFFWNFFKRISCSPERKSIVKNYKYWERNGLGDSIRNYFSNRKNIQNFGILSRRRDSLSGYKYR